MAGNLLLALKDKVLDGGRLTFSEAQFVCESPENNLLPLLNYACEIKEKYRRKIVNLCAITNARSGFCKEDCAFCGQSVHHNTGVTVYPLISEAEMLKRAEEVEDKTNRFCIVTSGREVNGKEIGVIGGAIRKIKKRFPCLQIDASLGILSERSIAELKNAGLDRYNHNLETAESFFAKICTSHTYADRIKTIKLVRKYGIEICCGGIIGLGESERQRIEFAFVLRELDIDSLPLNFLNPIPKTPLGDRKPLSPLKILKTIALFRFILPTKEIRICGGRQANLRSLQPLIFMAGADAIIVGNYLTTKGSLPEDDIKMIYDLGLSVDGIH